MEKMRRFYELKLSRRTCSAHQTNASDVPELKKPLSPLGIKGLRIWWPGAESNHRHKDFQSSALPTELPGLTEPHIIYQAARLPRVRSTPNCLSLRYRWVRSNPVFSATRVMEPPSLAR
jgi:hypothetical protein